MKRGLHAVTPAWRLTLLSLVLVACGGGYATATDAATDVTNGQRPPATATVASTPAPGTTPGHGAAPFPAGFAGYNTERLQATDEMPEGPTQTGAFRLRCQASHFAFDDPIVFPNQPGRSHLHVFFGNTGANAASTTESLTSSGNSTCNGGTVNRSSYWAPAVIDMRTNLAVLPTASDFYYKTGYNGVRPADIKPFPKGLRMIAGDPKNASAIAYGSHYSWVCRNNYPQNGQSLQNCAVGDQLEMSLSFPQCWDGVNLDSPDHKSHMAYANNGCPRSHPVALPEVSMHVLYPITEPNQATHWRLSSDTYNGPAGYSTHGDWWNGWNQTHLETWVRDCNVASMDCHSHLLGRGRLMY